MYELFIRKGIKEDAMEKFENQRVVHIAWFCGCSIRRGAGLSIEGLEGLPHYFLV